MAKEHPRYANMEWPEPEFQDYPRLIYPAGNDPTVQAARILPLRPGATPVINQGVLVHNAEEERMVMDGKPIIREIDEKADLLQRAAILGVRVDKRWGADKIQAAITEAEDA